MEKIGIDVHKVSSQVCILTETGELIERRYIGPMTTPSPDRATPPFGWWADWQSCPYSGP